MGFIRLNSHKANVAALVYSFFNTLSTTHTESNQLAGMVQIMWQTLTMVGSVLLYSTEQHRVLSKRSRSGRNDEVQWSQLLLDTVQRAYDEGLKIEVDELRKEISGLQKKTI